MRTDRDYPINQKPSWKDAPPWAQYLCKDHGEWYWAEYYPDRDGYVGQYQVASLYSEGTSQFPEQRPHES